VPQIRPLADTVHSKHLLTYLLSNVKYFLSQTEISSYDNVNNSIYNIQCAPTNNPNIPL